MSGIKTSPKSMAAPAIWTFDYIMRYQKSGRNVPGTHRKVAAHVDSFIGTLLIPLVQIYLVMIWGRPVIYDAATLLMMYCMECLGMVLKG